MSAYLDNAASGLLHPAAAQAMGPWLSGRFGNPSGSHRIAREARAAVEEARDVLAGFVGVEPGGLTFTSDGTESDNLAVLGALAARPGPVVVSAVEHPAVLEPARASGQEVRIAPVDEGGLVDLEALAGLLDPGVALVSIQLANNETGVVQPLERIAPTVRRLAPRALLHTDAVQALAWSDVRALAGSADLVSGSGHKMGGPQGIGFLAARGRPLLRPVVHGGGQERGLRSGTHNVAGIAGLAAAASAVAAERDEASKRCGRLRDSLAGAIREQVEGCTETAAGSERLPGHLHLRFEGVESEELLVLLDEAGVWASAGSACSSGAVEASHVLLAMGVPKSEALSSLRLSLGRATTARDVAEAATAVAASVARLRGE